MTGFGSAAALVATFFLGSVRATDQAVKVVDFGFQPARVTVTAGEVVTWQNTGSAQHTITADDASFDSGALASGEQYAHLFEAAVTVAYHCTIHPAMMGMVTINAAAATASPSGPPPPTPPLGTLPPNFTRHPDPSSAEPSPAPAVSAPVKPTSLPTSQTTAPPSVPAGVSDGTLPIVGLVVVGLGAVAVVAWLARRRRSR